MTSVISKFHCYRCETRWEELVTQCVFRTSKIYIKYRELLLDDENGKCGNRTQVLPQEIPENIEQKNDCEEWSIFMTNKHDVTVVKTFEIRVWFKVDGYNL